MVTNTQEKQLKRELMVSEAKSMVDWIHCVRPEVRQNTVVVRACSEAAHPHGTQEAERRKGREQDTAFQGMSQVNYLPQLSPTSIFYCLPIMLSYSESIKG